MSLHETWRTRQYWKQIGDGLLIEEFLAIPSSRVKEVGKRLIDGVIVLGEKPRIQTGGNFNLKGRDIIVVQTKKTRLGMYLMGQAYFSREIMKRFEPNSIRTVAICGKKDLEMEKICEEHDIEVVVIPDEKQPKHHYEVAD